MVIKVSMDPAVVLQWLPFADKGQSICSLSGGIRSTCALHGDREALLQLRPAVFQHIALAPGRPGLVVRAAGHVAQVVHDAVHRRDQPRVRVLPERLK